MKQNKALFVLNIIIFVILVVCILFDAYLVTQFIKTINEIANNTDGDNFGSGLGLAVLLILQIYLSIPYAVCLIVAIISMCKKYFNWLSISNIVMCGLGLVTTLLMILLV